MGLDSRFLAGEVQPILEFAGLQEKANHRLHTLSSGQRLRLGFAISTSVQHDIMLMDEWVGAGDAEFMARAKERMRSRVGGARILVLASHSIGLLRNICNKGIVLEKGRLVHQGDIVLPQIQSVEPLLQERHGIVIASGIQTIEPTVVNADEAEMLAVPVHSPAFLFERTTESEGGEVVEYVRSLYRGDRYRLVTELRPPLR